MAEQVPDDVKSERLARLQALIAGQARAFNQACIGRRLPVLFERRGRHDRPARREKPLAAGRTSLGRRRR